MFASRLQLSRFSSAFQAVHIRSPRPIAGVGVFGNRNRLVFAKKQPCPPFGFVYIYRETYFNHIFTNFPFSCFTFMYPLSRFYHMKQLFQMPYSQKPSSQMPSSQKPPSQVPPFQVPPSQMPSSQVPPSQVPPFQVPPSQMPPFQAPPFQAPPSQTNHL